MNWRKKRCTNPACRKVFTYAPGEAILCPRCQRVWRSEAAVRRFRFKQDVIPDAPPEGAYRVRLEGIAPCRQNRPPHILILRLCRELRRKADAATPSLEELARILDGVEEGRPVTLKRVNGEQLLALMQRGGMDFSYARMNAR